MLSNYNCCMCGTFLFFETCLRCFLLSFLTSLSILFVHQPHMVSMESQPFLFFLLLTPVTKYKIPNRTLLLVLTFSSSFWKYNLRSWFVQCYGNHDKKTSSTPMTWVKYKWICRNWIRRSLCNMIQSYWRGRKVKGFGQSSIINNQKYLTIIHSINNKHST